MSSSELTKSWHSRTTTTAELDPDDVFTALLDVSAAPGGGISVDVVPDQHDSLIIVTEDDRCMSARFSELLTQLTRARTTPTGLAEAIRDWVDTRPVSDRSAAAHGIAVVVRHDDELRWQVGVPRPSGITAAWVPTMQTSPQVVRAIRGAAMQRAQSLTFTPHTTGLVTVWTYLAGPALSPSILSQPDILHALAPTPDAVAVLTSNRPVAITDPYSAQRMVAEVDAPHLMVPLAHLTDLGWM